MTPTNLPMKQKQPHRHREKPVVAKREKGWAGWIRSLGLADGHYYTEDRETMRSYCIAQETVF